MVSGGDQVESRVESDVLRWSGAEQREQDSGGFGGSERCGM